MLPTLTIVRPESSFFHCGERTGFGFFSLSFFVLPPASHVEGPSLTHVETKDGNPYGWLALGRGARGRGFGGQATFIGWKKSVFKTSTGVPYRVYNSVPVVLYLKQFRTTGCTS